MTAHRTALGPWLIADVAALGIELRLAKLATIVVVRAVREDLRRAATALDADPALGIAGRTLACRLSWALGRLGDPDERRRAKEGPCP